MSAKKVKSTENVVAETATKSAAQTTKTVKAVNETNTNVVTFALAAKAIDNAETVAVLGSFNNWDVNKALLLTKQKNGSFKGTIELTKGCTYEYRFFVNNSIWMNDASAQQFIQTPFGVENCVVVA